MKTKTEVVTISLDNKPITSLELRAHARVLFQRYSDLGTDRAALEYRLASADADRAEAYDRALDEVESAANALRTARRKEHAARMRHADHGSTRTYKALHRAQELTALHMIMVRDRAVDLAQEAGRDSRQSQHHPIATKPDAWRQLAREAREANEDRINRANGLSTAPADRASAGQDPSIPD